MENKIYSINGPVVTIKGKTDLEMMEMVYVGKARLVGEVIRMNEKETTIQVYEETGGLKAGEPVESTGGPLSVTLGPGILRNIYDGIQRPLPAIEKDMGSFIERGAHEPSLDEQAKWDVTVTVKAGDTLTPGQIYATCPETPAIQHRCMVPPMVSGTVTWVAANGSYTVHSPVVKLTDAKGKEHTLTLCQKWPIRTPRPSAERMTSPRPLITGQRVIDTMFPLAKGGAAAIPGGFGTGKTMTQHQIAKWCDADIIIYVGCGERGNEMTQALQEFSELVDPRTGKSLMDRTVLIANTSNMPVAAREASIYTGITLAEYYRDMGYHAAMMADSTSRWAEALREISAAKKEVPGRRGYPGYLYTDLATMYERAGRQVGKDGSITMIPILTMPEDDKTHPIPDLTGYITEGQIILSRELYRRGINPPVDVLPSLSRLKDKGIGAGKTREDHSGTMNQLFAAYATGKENKELMSILGEAALSPTDLLYAKFADEFEKRYVAQGTDENRSIEQTLDLGWELLSLLPRSELKRIKPEYIDKYLKKEE
jgi:V/A-type H+-transporting ATPase subunit A